MIVSPEELLAMRHGCAKRRATWAAIDRKDGTFLCMNKGGVNGCSAGFASTKAGEVQDLFARAGHRCLVKESLAQAKQEKSEAL